MDSEPTFEKSVAPDERNVTNRVGMWIFVGQEILFFGTVFFSLLFISYAHPEMFANARRLSQKIAVANTAVLLTSSFSMALAVSYAAQLKANKLKTCLVWTMLFGTLFLVIKAYEYSVDIKHGAWPFEASLSSGERQFFALYLFATGLHAIHLFVGVVVVAFLLFNFSKKSFSTSKYSLLTNTALYWHFVDIVWLFLLPSFYFHK